MASYIKQLEKTWRMNREARRARRDREFFEKADRVLRNPFLQTFMVLRNWKGKTGKKDKPDMRAATSTSSNVEANITTFIWRRSRRCSY